MPSRTLSLGATPASRASHRTGHYLRRSLWTGTAIVLPVLITAFVLLLIIDLLSGLLNPLVIPIQ
jgi:uncharacterized membrane protein